MTTLAELVVKIGLDSSQFEREISGISGKVRAIGNDMQRIGGQLTRGLTLPIVGAGIASFKMFKDFEFAMQQIVGLVGVSQEQVDQWSKDLIRMGPELGKAPKELAEALYFVTSAGIDASDALNVVEMSAKASAAGLGETAVIADLVTSAMNAYGAENLNAAQATDILVAAVREGKAEAADMAGSLGKVLPIAAELGIEFHEVAAATAAMTRTGTDANTAATQLRAIMSSLLRPTKQAEEVLGMMGTSSSDLRKQIRDEGLLSALMELRDLTHEYGEETMAQVFPNIRALIGMLDLMGANIEDNVKIFDSLTDATGALDHAFETASQTAEFKWQQALASVQALLITLGDAVKTAVIPVIEDFIKKIGELVKWFQDLSPAAQQNIIRFAAYAAALGPVILILGKLITGFVGVYNAVTVLGRGLRLAIATIKLKVTALAGLKTAMALMAGPAGWIALAVVAIAGIGAAWYNASRDTEEAVRRITDESNAQFMRMTDNIRQQLVEQYEMVISQYNAISEDSIAIFSRLAETQVEIGHAGFELLMDNLEGEKEQKLAFLEEQYNYELDLLDRALATGVIKTQEEYEKMRQIVEEKFEQKRDIVETGYERINEIISGALSEGRELTEEESKEIVAIYERMYADIIGKMEEFVVQHKELEALKNTEINDMTEAQLEEYLKIVASAHERAGKELEQNVSDVIAILDAQLAAGQITIEQYEERYQEANQLLIDGNIEIAGSFSDMETKVNRALSNIRSEGIGHIVDLAEESTEQFGRMSKDSIAEADKMNLGVVDALRMMWKHIVGNSIIPDMVNGVLRWLGTMRGAGIPIVQAFASGMEQRMGELRTTVVGLLEQIWNNIRVIPGQAVGWGRSIVQGLISGIRGMAGSLSSALKSIVDSAINAAKNALGISSPSKVFLEFGSNISEGLALGIMQASDLVGKASVDMTDRVIEPYMNVAIHNDGGSKGLLVTHVHDLKNVPSGLNEDEIARMLIEAIKTPEVSREIDKVGYDNIHRFKGLGDF